MYEFWEFGTLQGRVCFVTDDIDLDQVVIVNSDEVASNYLQNQRVITREVDYRFGFRYCIYVVQQSITESAFNYWSAIGSEFERTGNIFETPPSVIRGNLYNPEDESEIVLGYFGAAASDTIRRLVESRELGIVEKYCRFNRRSDICGNCTLIPNSTTIRPDCW